MAYNAAGKWEYETANVAPRVTDLIATNNPLIKQARAQGLTASNRRGMLNSSMSAGAAQGEAYKAAIPIASQEAAQIQQSNLAEQDRVSQLERLNTDAAHTSERQGTDLAAQMERLRTQAGFTSTLQGQSDAAQLERLVKSGQISKEQQDAALAAAAEQQRVAGTQSIANIREQGSVTGGLQAQDAAAQMARLNASLAGATAQQREQIAAQMEQLRTQISGTSALAGQNFGYQTQLTAQQATAEMARLQAQLAGASAQQQEQIRAQMAQLQTQIAGTSALAAQQGTIQSGLNTQQAAAEMDRLRTSLAGASEQQKVAITAQMDQLRTQIAGQSALAAQQGGIQATLNDQQNAAEWARLQSSLANASASQQVDIKAQMDRLQANSENNLQQIAVQAGYSSQAAEQQFGYQQVLQSQQGTQQQQLATLQGSIQGALQASGAQQQQALALVQGTINSQLQSQGNAEQLGRMAAEFTQQTSTQAADQKNALERIAASGDEGMKTLAAQLQNSNQQLAMNLAQQDRQAIAASTVTIFQQEAAMRAALLQNTAIPAAERAAYEQAIAALGNPARNFINQLYGGPGGTAAPANSTGTGTAAPVGVIPPPANTDPLQTATGPGGGLNNGGALTGVPTSGVPINTATGTAVTSGDIVYNNGTWKTASGQTLTAAQVQAIYAKENPTANGVAL